MSKREEHIGVVFVLIEAVLWGIFPVVVNRGTQSIPPVTFAALTALIAAVGSFLYGAFQGKLHELKNTKAYVPLLMVTFCTVVIPNILFFIGASKTSGINSSLLLLAEIIFTLLFTPFFGEKTTRQKLIGALGVFAGAALILFNGTLRINLGDLLIIASTITFPLGNLYAKRALHLVSPAIILLVRFFLGGLFISAFALLTESPANFFDPLVTHWPLIFFTGFGLLGIGKVIWYEGLKRLDISKAISLMMTFPLYSLLLLMLVFKETPSVWQWIGISIMAFGVYFSIKRSSVDAALTKYAT